MMNSSTKSVEPPRIEDGEGSPRTPFWCRACNQDFNDQEAQDDHMANGDHYRRAMLKGGTFKRGPDEVAAIPDEPVAAIPDEVAAVRYRMIREGVIAKFPDFNQFTSGKKRNLLALEDLKIENDQQKKVAICGFKSMLDHIKVQPHWTFDLAMRMMVRVTTKEDRWFEDHLSIEDREAIYREYKPFLHFFS